MSCLDQDFTRMSIHQGEGPTHHAHVLSYGLKHGRYNLSDVHAAIENLADLKKEEKFLDLPFYRGAAILPFHWSPV